MLQKMSYELIALSYAPKSCCSIGLIMKLNIGLDSFNGVLIKENLEVKKIFLLAQLILMLARKFKQYD